MGKKQKKVNNKKKENINALKKKEVLEEDMNKIKERENIVRYLLNDKNPEKIKNALSICVKEDILIPYEKIELLVKNGFEEEIKTYFKHMLKNHKTEILNLANNLWINGYKDVLSDLMIEKEIKPDVIYIVDLLKSNKESYRNKGLVILMKYKHDENIMNEIKRLIRNNLLQLNKISFGLKMIRFLELKEFRDELIKEMEYVEENYRNEFAKTISTLGSTDDILKKYIFDKLYFDKVLIGLHLLNKNMLNKEICETLKIVAEKNKPNKKIRKTILNILKSIKNNKNVIKYIKSLDYEIETEEHKIKIINQFRIHNDEKLLGIIVKLCGDEDKFIRNNARISLQNYGIKQLKKKSKSIDIFRSVNEIKEMDYWHFLLETLTSFKSLSKLKSHITETLINLANKRIKHMNIPEDIFVSLYQLIRVGQNKSKDDFIENIAIGLAIELNRRIYNNKTRLFFLELIQILIAQKKIDKEIGIKILEHGKNWFINNV